MLTIGAIGLAVFVALSAWLGAFEGRSDVFFMNESARDEAKVAALSGEPGPFRLMVSGRESPRARDYPSEEACQQALQAELAAGDRASAAPTKDAPRVWAGAMCVPISHAPRAK